MAEKDQKEIEEKLNTSPIEMDEDLSDIGSEEEIAEILGVQKVSSDVAKKDLFRWLNFRRVNKHQLKEYSGKILKLKSLIESGDLVFNQDNSITQNLEMPIGEGESIRQLTYKSRLTAENIAIAMKGIGANDADGRMRGYVSAITGVSKSILLKLDSGDFGVAQDIALFFV